MSKTIPIVDFYGYINGNDSDKLNVSKELIDVIRQHGFAYLKNYGISNGVIQDMFKYSKQFFEKPDEYKRRVKKSFETFCGYCGLEEEKLIDFRPGDLKEFYMIKGYGTPWPDDWPQFREFMLQFHSDCYKLAQQILQSIAIGLDLEKTIFEPKFKNGESTLLRLLYYPPLPNEIKENQIRAGEHTDYGLITLLYQDPVGGLEVKTKSSGDWISAVYQPDTILINVGDVMKMLTNGELPSTPHRVVNPSDDRKTIPRYSTVFFCDPDLSCEVECIDKFVSEANPAKYQKIFYKQHLSQKYVETYSVTSTELNKWNK